MYSAAPHLAFDFLRLILFVIDTIGHPGPTEQACRHVMFEFLQLDRDCLVLMLVRCVSHHFMLCLVGRWLLGEREGGIEWCGLDHIPALLS